MTEYGLAVDRDPDTGDPSPVDHSFEWSDEEVTIRMVPPTLEQISEYEEVSDDNEEALRGIVEDHLVKPDHVPVEKLTMREVNCYLYGIRSWGDGDQNDAFAQLQEAIKERNGRGNQN